MDSEIMIKKSSKLVFLFLLNYLFASGILIVSAQNNNEWPCFHGSNRENKSNEIGLLNAWPETGPQLLWTISGLGEGYSSITIGNNLIYTSGKIDNQTYVFAYELNGKLRWKKPNGEAWDVKVPWASSYNGSKGTPTYNNGVIYHLSEAGRLTAYYSNSGDMIWSRKLTDDFKAVIPDYGFTESVLVDGDKLFVKPAGQRGFQVCLNKKTGATIWVNNEISGLYGYNSLVISDFGGFHQIIGASSNCYYGIDSETGLLLWKVDFENRHSVNCSDAMVFKEYVFLTSGEGGGCALIKLKSSGKSIATEKIWQTDVMDNYHGGVVLHNGNVYGSGSSARSWFCIDLFTGKQLWKTAGNGSIVYADGMIYLYDEKGTIKLVKASPDKFEKTGEFKVPNGGLGPYWVHPVVCGKRLYLRHADKLFAYDIGGK